MVGSWSRPISRPVGPTFSASNRAWPPAPRVASTRTWPGWGSRAASTSAASTGTCRVDASAASVMGAFPGREEDEAAHKPPSLYRLTRGNQAGVNGKTIRGNTLRSLAGAFGRRGPPPSPKVPG